MTTEEDIAYWDDEAISDPRYATGAWGMNGEKDAHVVIPQICAIVSSALPHIYARVLEIGCGPARLLVPLAKQHLDAEFYGVDISPEMLWIAQRRIDKAMLKNRVRVSAPTLHRNMDVVYCVELMQHLDDAAARDVIAAAHEALRPGGLFVSQWVIEGEPGPRSFPRNLWEISGLISNDWVGPPHAKYKGGGAFDWSPGLVHPQWGWLVVAKR